MQIKEVKARKILDSRRQETVEVSVFSDREFISSAPEGKSKGRFEAKPYFKNINQDILYLNNLDIRKIKIEEFADLKEIENLTAGKMGANSLFALEASILKALAFEQGQGLWEYLSRGKPKKFPFPLGNAIGGGMHTNSLRGKKPDFQDFLVIPKTRKFGDNVFLMKKMHSALGEILAMKNAKGKLNDENAWGTSLDNEAVLEILNKNAEAVSDEAGCKIEIGIDAAASSFFKNNFYEYKNKPRTLNREEQMRYIEALSKNYDLFYMEDPLQEEDFEGFSELREKIIPIVSGDDLIVTNMMRLKKAVQKKSINAVIIKPNQNGSLLKVREICDFCRKEEIATVFSHRSGETQDNSLGDLAVAWKADFIKTGILGKERDAKLNRIIEIERNF